MKRIVAELIWDVEHRFTVNPNEARLRKIFRQGEGCLLAVTSELVLRRRDLEIMLYKL